MLPDLEFHVDRLYQLPPGEFTPARNALAARVKAAGDAAAAARVKALERPSVSAWAVNQLYWRARPDFAALVEAGDRLRAGQAQLLAGREVADFQDVFAARLRVVGRALKTIDGLAVKADVDLSPAIRRRVQTTIEAIASQGTSGERPFDGRLTGDLTPPGFEALVALAAMPPPPAGGRGAEAVKVSGDERKADAQRREHAAHLGRAQTAVAAAEADARAATADAARADAAAEAAERRAAEARDDVAAARRQLTDAMARATRALDVLKDVTRARARTSAAREKAEQALQAARIALGRLQR